MVNKDLVFNVWDKLICATINTELLDEQWASNGTVLEVLM